TLLLPILFLLIAGCVQPVSETPAPEIVDEPTATEDFIPVVPANTRETILFSFVEDGYAHLFAYIPGQMPITRLTNGAWDDIAPAASPDGKQVAFASNRNGFWDLYLMDLSSGEVTQLTDTPEYEGAPTWSPDSTFLAY